MENQEIKKTLVRIFQENSAGINWASVNDNLLPLVIYAKRHITTSSRITNSTLTNHFLMQLKLICKKISRDDFFTKVSNAPSTIPLSSIYDLLLDNWDALKGWTITYRLLSDLIILSDEWICTAEENDEFINTLNAVTSSWN